MKNLINASYDEIADVLYLTSGKISLTENSEDEPGLVLRYDAKTQMPVGATIIDFKEYWIPQRQHLIEALSNFFHISTGEVSRVIRAVH
jgi:hypothetical protein